MPRAATYEHAWAAVDIKRFPFVYPTPWALIRRNGGLQLAYITKVRGDADGQPEFRGKIWSHASQCFTVGDCRIRTILKTWKHPPHWKTVALEKARLNKRARAGVPERSAA